MNIVIIEDEPGAAQELQHLLEKLVPVCNILACLDSVSASVNWFNNYTGKIDVIFSDIQLGDGLCFSIFGNTEINTPVIFCTAYDEYLLQAFDANAVSYILKPIIEKKVAESLQKLESMKKAFGLGHIDGNRKIMQQLLQQLQPSYKNTLLIHYQDKLLPIPAAEVAFFYLNEGVVKLVTLKNVIYHVTESLELLESQLPPDMFFRANRQFIINRKSVQVVNRHFGRKLVVALTLEVPEPVIISKVKSSYFLSWLQS